MKKPSMPTHGALPKNRRANAWLPLLLTGVVGAVLAAMPGTLALRLFYALVVAMVCGVSMLWCARQRDRERTATELRLQASPNIADLCEVVLPIWRTQIDTGRSQTEQAIMDLTSRFAGLSQRLQLALTIGPRSAWLNCSSETRLCSPCSCPLPSPA